MRHIIIGTATSQIRRPIETVPVVSAITHLDASESDREMTHSVNAVTELLRDTAACAGSSCVAVLDWLAVANFAQVYSQLLQ